MTTFALLAQKCREAAAREAQEARAGTTTETLPSGRTVTIRSSEAAMHERNVARLLSVAEAAEGEQG